MANLLFQFSFYRRPSETKLIDGPEPKSTHFRGIQLSIRFIELCVHCKIENPGLAAICTDYRKRNERSIKTGRKAGGEKNKIYNPSVSE